MELVLQFFQSNHLSLGISNLNSTPSIWISISNFITPPTSPLVYHVWSQSPPYGAWCPILSFYPPLPWYIKSELNPLYMELDIQFHHSSHLSLSISRLISTTSLWSLMSNFIILPTSPLAILSPCPEKGYRALTCGTLISCTTSFMTSFSTISSTSSSVSTSASSS